MIQRLPFEILPQPDDVSCGPTCLHSIYNYYGSSISLKNVIKDVAGLDEGGTLAVFLGIDALKRGFKATIFTYNLRLFDPTWFSQKTDLPEKLRLQMKVKKKKRKLVSATKGYLEFLARGGKIEYRELTGSFIRKFLNKGIPVLTGLSSTYLYNEAREIGETNQSDDIAGEVAGHFVVLCGYDKDEKNVIVADPYPQNPLHGRLYYHVKVNHLIASILLGILTYDSNLLVVEPG